MIESRLNENQKKSLYTLQSDVNNYYWATFYLLNVLDVYSSLKGLEYSCVVEVNPLLPERPHKDHLILHKAITVPAIFNSRTFDNDEVMLMNIFMTHVIIENYKVIEEVKSRPNCIKK